MKTDYKCLPCFLTQAITAIKFATSNKKKQQRAIRKIIAYLFNIDMEHIPAFTAGEIYRIVRRETKCNDPFKKIKKKYNRIALELYPSLKRQYIEPAKDKLLNSLLLSVAGNIIDFGFKNNFNLNDTISSSLKVKFPKIVYGELKRSIKRSRSILILADNAGEIVFDKFILEEIEGKKLIVAVKGAPVINDATLDDANFCGISDLAEIITTGTDDVGVNLERASNKFLKYFNSADMIISKGQANYETLYKERKNIFFLLKVKCLYLCEMLGKKLYEPVLIGPKRSFKS